MKHTEWIRAAGAVVLGAAGLCCRVDGERIEGRESDMAPNGSYRLPAGVMPDLGCWFWIGEEAFEPGAYREFVDAVAVHSVYGLLTTSLRAPDAEITRREVHQRIKEATLYAQERGIGIVMDLDVRLARRAFERQYPDELQEMLRLREVELNGSSTTALRINGEVLNDHYTGGGAEPYLPVSGRFVRAYAYGRGPEGILPDTVEDITDTCEVVEASPEGASVRLPASEADFTARHPDRRRCTASHAKAFLG